MSSCLYSTSWIVIGRACRPVVGCSYVWVFPGVFPYGRHPRFRDFDPVVPVDVVRVEADLDPWLGECARVDLCQCTWQRSSWGHVRSHWRVPLPQRSDSARDVRLSRAPSFSPALVFPSPRCRQRCTRRTGSCIPLHLVFREGLGPSAVPGGYVELCRTVRMPCCSRQRRSVCETLST